MGRLPFEAISEDAIITHVPKGEILWFGFGDSEGQPQTIEFAFGGLKASIDWPSSLSMDGFQEGDSIRRFVLRPGRQTETIDLQVRGSRLQIHLATADHYRNLTGREPLQPRDDNDAYRGYRLP